MRLVGAASLRPSRLVTSVVVPFCENGLMALLPEQWGGELVVVIH
jgi:hypothetical protein